MALKSEEFIVSSGKQALDLFVSFQPDIVVLDLGLPDMDGTQVLKRLRSNQGKLPKLT